MTVAAIQAPTSGAADRTGEVASAARADILGGLQGPVLLAAIALSLLAVLWTVVLHQLEGARVEAIASAVKDTENLSRVMEEHVVRTFMDAEQLAWSLKQHIERRGLPRDLVGFVKERTRPGSPVLVVGVADEHGMLVRNSIPTKPFSIAGTVHFKAHVASDSGALAIGHPSVGRLSGKCSLYVSHRLNRPDGSFGGVASVAIEQSYFSRLYNQVALGPAGGITLIGRDGVVRAWRGSTPTGGSVRTSAILDRVGERPAGAFIADSAGGEPPRLLAYRALAQYPLVVVVGRSLDDVLAPYAEHRRTFITGAAMVSIFIGVSFALLGWLMARQRRAAVLLREANERAESANRVKSDFLANMTHELRTPLNGIIGFADCLRDELHDASQRECARIIYTSGCTLLGMVNSALDLAKIEAGGMALNPSRESARLLIEEVVALQAAAAERKGLGIEIRVGDEVPEEIVCDRARLQQVLANLLDNAVKFTREGRIAVSARVDAAELRISVSDSGCGVAPELHAAIFERFRQADNLAVGVRGGTGLGLALARDLVHLMGGRMEIESEPGRGSVFRVVLPLRTAL